MKFNKEKFQELREKSGLTMDEIAKACEVSKQTVQKWEKHPTLKPRPKKIAKLAEILACDESELAEFGKSKSMKFNRTNFIKLRQDRGLTQKQIAEAVGVVEASVSGWENGTNSPRPAKIAKLAEILNCEKSDLADYSAETATITGITGSLKRIESMVREMPQESSQEEASELMTTAAALMITICKFYEGIKP